MTDLLAQVSQAARDAGAMALSRWQGEFNSWDKVPGHIVCDIDLAANDMLRAALRDLDPEAGWLSEETADSAERLMRSRVWVVDPIDGTRDFVRGRPGWAVSVGLVSEGRPLFGMLAAPARQIDGEDEFWSAEAGHGAWRNGQRLVASTRTELAGARVPTDMVPSTDSDLVMVDKPNSIALRVAMVAADEADLLATLRWGFEWDVAAAALIAREAGAAVSDAFGQPLAYNKRDPRAFGVLVTAPAIHDAAIARLAERAEQLGR